LLANFNGKEHLRHRAVSLRQHGFLVIIDIYLLLAAHKRILATVLAIQPVYFLPVSLRSLCVCYCLVGEF